jgi:hypothetical protein
LKRNHFKFKERDARISEKSQRNYMRDIVAVILQIGGVESEIKAR